MKRPTANQPGQHGQHEPKPAKAPPSPAVGTAASIGGTRRPAAQITSAQFSKLRRASRVVRAKHDAWSSCREPASHVATDRAADARACRSAMGGWGIGSGQADGRSRVGVPRRSGEDLVLRV
jgi:hypothetical protein